MVSSKPWQPQQPHHAACMLRWRPSSQSSLCLPQTEHAKEHYSDLSTKPFFNGLVSFICSSPVVAMVWQGEHGVV